MRSVFRDQATMLVDDARASGDTRVAVTRSLRDWISARPSVSSSGVMLVISRLRRPSSDRRRLPGSCQAVLNWASLNDGRS